MLSIQYDASQPIHRINPDERCSPSAPPLVCDARVSKTAATALTRADDDDGDATVPQSDPVTDNLGEGEERQPPREVQQQQRQQPRRRIHGTRCRRVLWFNASHERDVLPLLDLLASARARTHGHKIRGCGNISDSSPDGLAQDDDAPLFDSACFMEVPPARPSRITPPTAQEILAPRGMSPVDQANAEGLGAVSSEACACAAGEGERGDTVPEAREVGSGGWQRTLEQVISLRRFSVFCRCC